MDFVPQLTRFPHQGVIKISPPYKSPGKHLCKKPWAPVKRSSQGTQAISVNLSVQFSSVTQSCATLCDPMDCSTLGLPGHHQLPELAQTHVYQLGDAIQPSHPLSSFSSCLQSFPASGSFPMSQFFATGGQSIGVSASASVLPMNIQD